MGVDDKALIQMTISLIILNQLSITSTIYIMQEGQDLIQMIMNPIIEYLGEVYKYFQIKSIHLLVYKFVLLFNRFGVYSINRIIFSIRISYIKQNIIHNRTFDVKTLYKF